MPWNCSICALFAADDLKTLLNHIGRCHRNDPNFHCVCGIDGCAKTFKKYYTWRKHIKKKHEIEMRLNGNVQHNLDPEIVPHQNLQNQDLNPIEQHANQDQVTKSSALYLLKLQEDCLLPKTTVKSVVENTKTIVEETLSVVKSQVQECLTQSSVDFESIPGLSDVFKEDNAATNPFHSLETETEQEKYYKENFHLKVFEEFVMCTGVFSILRVRFSPSFQKFFFGSLWLCY